MSATRFGRRALRFGAVFATLWLECCLPWLRPYSGDQSTSGQRGPRAGTFLYWGDVCPAVNEGQDLWFSLHPLLVLVIGGLFAVLPISLSFLLWGFWAWAPSFSIAELLAESGLPLFLAQDAFGPH